MPQHSNGKARRASGAGGRAQIALGISQRAISGAVQGLVVNGAWQPGGNASAAAADSNDSMMMAIIGRCGEHIAQGGYSNRQAAGRAAFHLMRVERGSSCPKRIADIGRRGGKLQTGQRISGYCFRQTVCRYGVGAGLSGLPQRLRPARGIFQRSPARCRRGGNRVRRWPLHGELLFGTGLGFSWCVGCRSENATKGLARRMRLAARVPKCLPCWA